MDQMKKYLLISAIVSFGLTGCATVPEEDLSTYNIRKTVTHTATYPEQEIERLLKQAYGDMDVLPAINGLSEEEQNLDLANKPADYEIVLDLYAKDVPPAEFLVDGIKTYEMKTLRIVISSPYDIKFEIPAERGDVLKSSYKSSASTIINDKITYQVTHYIRLNPTKAGSFSIPIQNNLFGKDFDLTVKVVDSGRTIDSLAGELGFEAFLEHLPTEEEINQEFRKPNFRSVGFKDGFRFVSYIFDDYYVLYHVLFKDDKVYDVRRVELGQ